MMMIEYPQLYARAEAARDAFGGAAPFPHAVLDRLLDAPAYAQLRDVFPEVDDPMWKLPSNVHTRRKWVTRRGAHGVKELLYSAAARAALRELNSGSFLHFLELLSGVAGLLPDPYFAEAGFHCSGDGGFLDIHADFSHHDGLGLERRLNLILFLNDDWRPEYGGALSLYDRELEPVVSVPPVGNRAVIFETSAVSYHGHPEPMRLPPETYRRSVALYYYSVPTGRPRTKIVFPRDPNFTHVETKE